MIYENLGRDIGKLVDEKQKAYGRSFQKAPDILRVLYPDGVKPEQYGDMLTLVRIIDKQVRIANGDKAAFGENPYRDIAGYGLLGAGESETNKICDNCGRVACKMQPSIRALSACSEFEPCGKVTE